MTTRQSLIVPMLGTLAVLPLGCGSDGSHQTSDTASDTGETTSGPGDTGETTETGEPTETGDEESGPETGGEPCDGACPAEAPLCHESTDTCVECLGPEDCDDGFACTLDSCDAGACVWAFDDVEACEPVWGNAQPAHAPPPRAWPSMAFDAARSEVLLFGGISDQIHDDTWIWDGSDWTQRDPAESPPARLAGGTAYDASRERIVIFGGKDMQFGLTALGDTWEWDGETWLQVETDDAPSDRVVHFNMTYDPDLERVLLFGGGIAPGEPTLKDLWAYDGDNWTLLDDGQDGPQERIGACFQNMGFGGGTLLFAGGRWDPHFDDTWVYDRASWSMLTPDPKPSARQSMMCTHDSLRDRVVLLGGGLNGQPPMQDMWEFDGVNWSLQSATAPYPTCCEGLTYDSERREVVLFTAGETWLYGPPG